MKTKILLIGFAAMAIIQLAIPGQMAYENELAYSGGTEYKFKTKPIDPTDPFRGKYIWLDFEADTIRAKKYQFSEDEKVYALLGKDKEGFAKVTKLQTKKPEKGDYVLVDIGYNYDGIQHFDFKFNRFYMEESKAPDAEILYSENNNNENKLPAYAVVSVRCEVAVVKDVIVGGLPIKEYVEKHQKNPSEKVD
ncbi:GDYXXLXY domain-containing protein [Flavobacterium sp. RHBU_3]|uniref:GDYXXLXY domain-containing protein n=1 Tax=Flavobacterium sp. RHBU_3 TaxID=3391184 RepID=UPI00398481AF